MANPTRRVARIFLLLFSLAGRGVFGSVRGVIPPSDKASPSETIDNVRTRGLKRKMHHKAKGEAKRGEVLVTEYPETIVLTHPKGGTKGGEKGGGTKEGGKGGGSQVPGVKEGGKGGGVEASVVKDKIKGSKQSKDKGTKDGTAEEVGKEKGGKSKKASKTEVSLEDKATKGSKSKTSKYDGKAVEKRPKEYKGKSKDKLMKSADDLQTYFPTEEPSGHTTLVEVPLTFHFAFGKPQDNTTTQAHDAVEPTAEEMETLQQALHEYAVGLFDYLHEDKPGTFLSVTPTIDGVDFQPGVTHPLNVNTTFHVLYNESPETAPDIAEVAEILEDAFTTDEFMYFYLWGRDDIWNSVSEVTVKANVPEGPEKTSAPGPEAEVLATMVYDFSTGPTTEPTEADFDELTALTQSYFTDLLTDIYAKTPDTTFEELVVTRHATTYDLTATPPVIVDFSFMIKFSDNSLIYPSSEELFGIMKANTFDAYIKVYLEPCNCFWSSVNRVGFLEYVGPETEAPAGAGSTVRSSMMHSFFPGMEVRPSKEDYEKLESATSAFFHEILTAYYANVTDMLMTTTHIESQYYNEALDETTLQVDYNTTVVVPGGENPAPEEVLSVLQAAEFETYIMDYLWKEGDPWTNINGVMLLERIPPPLSP